MLNTVSNDFFAKILNSGTSLLEISLEITLESYKLSKLSKIKKILYQKNHLQNFLKLTSFGIKNWFINKLEKNIDSYELTQQVIEKMRDNTQFLIESLENY